MIRRIADVVPSALSRLRFVAQLVERAPQALSGGFADSTAATIPSAVSTPNLTIGLTLSPTGVRSGAEILLDLGEIRARFRVQI